MTVRDILHHLSQVYGTQLSREQVWRIIGAVLGIWLDRTPPSLAAAGEGARFGQVRSPGWPRLR